ncbi:amidohydrolase [Clostridiaceae bacterium M8S5]|nr:amidohydrolase [Clostridiaceae bacterium M8S5]
MDILQEVITIRRDLHQIPETGFNEIKTSGYIKDKLSEYGFKYEICAKTGVIAYKDFDPKAETIAFRSDIDALNVLEQTGANYSSKHKGKMHACGHDGHMAILLGFAKYISTKETKKNILLIFQPAEEGPGGAKVIVDEGILEKYNVSCIFGLHILPAIKEGLIGINHGPIMARTGEFDITIKAKSGHGAMPHTAVDGIYIASQLISSLQSIVSRNVDPNEGSVLTIGKIQGGEARNIIANTVRLEGTIRAFNNDVYDLIKQRMHTINEGVMKMYGIEIDMDFTDMYPPVINDRKLYELMDKCLVDNEKLELKPMMISEDFSYYQEKVPGLFFMLGSRNEKLNFTYPLHSCYFDFNEEILQKGVEVYTRICKELDVFK